MSPADLPIAEAGALMRQGRLTSVDLAEAHLARIDATDERLNAFVAVTRDRALQAARQADAELAAGLDRGAMHGIPYAVKDLIDVAGLPTLCGASRGAVAADADAHVVAAMTEAGGVLLGKLATYEYALVGPSFDGARLPAVNPWDAERITGGSSSGAASAVASGLVRMAVGTDTGGSIRSPAAYCGVVGLKPSYDAVSRRGVFPLSASLDHVGPLAATVDDAAIGFSAMTGRALSWPKEIRGLRIGYARDWFADDPAVVPAVVEALDDMASVLTLLGAGIELVHLPDYALAEAAGAVILHAEALEVHGAALRDRPESYGRKARQTLAGGAALDAEALALARAEGLRFRARIDACLGRYDAILTATTLTPAPELAPFREEKAVWTPMRTLPFNVSGHPVLALPAGFDGHLPLSLQIVTRHGDEAMACRIGAALEAATDHALRRPPLAAR